MASTDYVVNPLRAIGDRAQRFNFPRAFHQRMPGHSPTPLLDLDLLAAELGIGKLWVKDESWRFGLPSFEILGAAWALYRAVLDRLGRRPAKWDTLDELRERLAGVGPVRMVSVSDGGFALATARVARWFGFGCRVYVPGTMAPARLDLIDLEGAEVDAEAASYDEALARAARETDPRTIILSDSSWEGFEDIPRWVTEGYTTIFEEIDEELCGRGARAPDAVVVPLGTGALAAAAGLYYRASLGITGAGLMRHVPPDVWMLGVEPASSPCFVESARTGRRQPMPAPAPSVMDSLARGLPSPQAWDTVGPTFDAFAAVSDARAIEAVELLREHGIWASPAGAAPLGGLLDLLGHRDSWSHPIGPASDVLIIVGEGVVGMPR